MTEWISIKDRLPEPNVDVCVFSTVYRDKELKTSGFLVARLDENKIWHIGKTSLEVLDAFKLWKPIPEGDVIK